MEFISIGPYCCTAYLLKEHRLRRTAYPFDYIFSSLEIVKHALKDKFNIFLDKQYYAEGTAPDSTRHTFYCNLLDTEVLLQHHIIVGMLINLKVWLVVQLLILLVQVY